MTGSSILSPPIPLISAPLPSIPPIQPRPPEQPRTPISACTPRRHQYDGFRKPEPADREVEQLKKPNAHLSPLSLRETLLDRESSLGKDLEPLGLGLARTLSDLSVKSSSMLLPPLTTKCERHIHLCRCDACCLGTSDGGATGEATDACAQRVHPREPLAPTPFLAATEILDKSVRSISFFRKMTDQQVAAVADDVFHYTVRLMECMHIGCC